MATPASTQPIALQPADRKRPKLVQRKRVRNLMPELRRQIPALFDATLGDYDRVAEDLGIPRADVLAVVLHDTRRKQPGSSPTSSRPFVVARREVA